MGDAGASSMAEALKVNTSLSYLNLDFGGSFGDAATAALSDALKINRTLTHLSLWGKGIGDTGASLLDDALKVNSTLTRLDLRHNHISDAMGKTSINEDGRNHYLKNLFSTNFNDDEAY